MAQIGQNTLHNWQDGETVTGKNMNMNMQLIQTAVNDNFTKMLKQIQAKDITGAVKTLHQLDGTLTQLNFQDTGSVTVNMDANGNLSFTVSTDSLNTTLNTTTVADPTINTGTLTQLLNILAARVQDAQASAAFAALTNTWQMQPVTFAMLKQKNVTFGMLRSGQVPFYSFRFWRYYQA